MDFYSPKELLTMYPQLGAIWKVEDIGYLLRLKLVRGRKINKNVRCEVSATDVLKLFEITKEK